MKTKMTIFKLLTTSLILALSLLGKAEDSMTPKQRYENSVTMLNELHNHMEKISKSTMIQFNDTLKMSLGDLKFFLQDYSGANREEYVKGLAEKIGETLLWGIRQRGRDRLHSDIDQLQEEALNKDGKSAAVRFLMHTTLEMAQEMAFDIKDTVTFQLPSVHRRQKMYQNASKELSAFVDDLEKLENDSLKESIVGILGQVSSDLEVITSKRSEGSKWSIAGYIAIGLVAMINVPVDLFPERTYVSALISATGGFLIPAITYSILKMKYGVHNAWLMFNRLRWKLVDLSDAMEAKTDAASRMRSCSVSLSTGS